MKRNKCIFPCERSIRNGTDSVLKGRGRTEETEPKSVHDGNTISCDEVSQLEARRHVSFRKSSWPLRYSILLIPFETEHPLVTGH